MRSLVVLIICFVALVSSKEKRQQVEHPAIIDTRYAAAPDRTFLMAELVDDYPNRFAGPTGSLLETKAQFKASAKVFRMSQEERRQEYLHGYDHGYEHGFRHAQELYAPQEVQTPHQDQNMRFEQRDQDDDSDAPAATSAASAGGVAASAGETPSTFPSPAANAYATQFGQLNGQQPAYYSAFAPYYSYPPPPPPLPTYLPPPPYITPGTLPKSQ